MREKKNAKGEELLVIKKEILADFKNVVAAATQSGKLRRHLHL